MYAAVVNETVLCCAVCWAGQGLALLMDLEDVWTRGQTTGKYLFGFLFVFLEADNKSALVWLENHVAQENRACWVGSVLGLA